jgi:23S rRNA pseudoU1915 N3-methylase RlmH
MGNTQTVQKINFEDIQYVIKNAEMFMLINILPNNEQDCLIYSTSDMKKEEEMINYFIKMGTFNVKLIIYGKNCNDNQVYNKEEQLRKLGFKNIFVYSGGLFEWLMLQDIYGVTEFPTTSYNLDILKYKPIKKLNLRFIEF